MKDFFFRIIIGLSFLALVLAGVNVVNHYKDKTPPVESKFQSSMEIGIIIEKDPMRPYPEQFWNGVTSSGHKVKVTETDNGLKIEFLDPPVLYPESWIESDGSCPKCVEWEAENRQKKGTN